MYSEHERDEGTEIILSPNRDNRLETRNGNGRLDFGRSHPMHHTSRRDDSINYDAEDSEANEPSIDGQSFSGSRSRRTTGVRGTWGQHLETHSLYGYGVITSEFGSAEWFRAMEDLFRRSRGREGIPEGQPGVILEETDGTEITRIPNPNLGNGGSAKEARGGHDGTWERCAKIDIG